MNRLREKSNGQEKRLRKIFTLILMDINDCHKSVQWFWHSSLDLTYGEFHYLCALLPTLALTLETQTMVFPRSVCAQDISHLFQPSTFKLRSQ